MDLKVGKVLFDQAQQAQVLDDQGVRADGRQGVQVPGRLGQVFFLEQGIESHKDFSASFVGQIHHPGQVLQGKVGGKGPSRIFLEAQINRIRPGFQGRGPGGGAAGRGQQFRAWGQAGLDPGPSLRTGPAGTGGGLTTAPILAWAILRRH